MKLKLLLALLFCFALSVTIAQTIQLPTYKKGHYQVNTIFSHYDPFGDESVAELGHTLSTFISGVQFKVVIDSIRGDSAFKEFAGKRERMYKGDTLNFPVRYNVYRGTMGFHFIVEGTPLISGESYLCDLFISRAASLTPTSQHFTVFPASEKKCTVNPSSDINEYNQPEKSLIYPNPLSHTAVLKFNYKASENYRFSLYDVLGNMVKTITNINTGQVTIEKGNTAPGVYFYKLWNTNSIVSNGKLIVE